MDNLFSLAGKRILVTGASSGIGKETAIVLASMGAHLIIAGRNAERLQETFEHMTGSSHEIVIADLLKKNDISILSEKKEIDGVVFNAGIVEYLPVKFIPEEKIKKIFDTNFSSTVLLCQQLLRNKAISRNGSLVFISSVSAKLGVPGTALYAASKAAISAFARVVASEAANQGIRSNSISPGIVKSPMTEQAKMASSEREVSNAEQAYPLKYGTTTDVAGVVAFLLSDASKWMTGSDLILDGGLTLS